jgi:hypothetical protein
LLEFMHDYRDLDAIMLDGKAPESRPGRGGGGTLKHYAEIIADIATLAKWTRDDIDPDTMRVAVFPPYVVQIFRKLPAAMLAARFGRGEPLLRASGEFYHLHPEGLGAFVYGTQLRDAGHLDEAERVLLEGLDLPSYLNCRRIGRLMTIIVEEERLSKPNPPEGLRERLRNNIRAYLAVNPPGDVSRYAYLFNTSLRIPDLALSRSITSDWMSHAPTDPEALAAQANVELRSDAFGPAITLSRKALEQKPEHEAARAVLDAAVPRLREQAARLTPSETSETDKP